MKSKTINLNIGVIDCQLPFIKSAENLTLTSLQPIFLVKHRRRIVEISVK